MEGVGWGYGSHFVGIAVHLESIGWRSDMHNILPVVYGS